MAFCFHVVLKRIWRLKHNTEKQRGCNLQTHKMRLHRAMWQSSSPGVVQGFPVPLSLFVTHTQVLRGGVPGTSLFPGSWWPPEEDFAPSKETLLVSSLALAHTLAQSSFPSGHPRPRLLYFAVSAPILTGPPATSFGVSPHSVLAHSAIATHLTLHFRLVRSCGEG